MANFGKAPHDNRGKREKRGPEHGLDFREMAMKKNLILAALILLATLWFALDAGVEAMILFT